jgi:hypothetical protein
LGSVVYVPPPPAPTTVAPEFELQFSELTRSDPPAADSPVQDGTLPEPATLAAADAELSADPAPSPTDSAPTPA